VVGGLWSCLFLTLLVLPAAYAMWRRGQVRRANIAAEDARALAVDGAEPRVEPVTPLESVAPDAEMASASAEASDLVPADTPSPDTDVTPGAKPNGDSEELS
jgi:hypothetical protein